MASRRFLSEKSIEELLNDLDTAEIDVDYIDNVHKFLTALQIKSGPHAVNVAIIRKLYFKWTNEPINQRTLVTKLAEYFQINATSRYIYLDKEPVEFLRLLSTLKKRRKIDKTKSPKYRKQFERFIKAFNLTRGFIYLEGYILYHLYDKWVYHNKYTRVFSEDSFIKFCHLYFQKGKLVRGIQTFGISESILTHLNRETINNIRTARKRYNVPKRKKQAQQREISSIKARIKSKD